MKKEREEHRLDFHTTRMFPSASEAPTEKTWLKEMSEGINGLDQNKEEEASSSLEEVNNRYPFLYFILN